MTYEYACSSCGHAWEAEQSISAAPLTECPNCKQATAKRQVSGGAGFILKGGGWYADLYSSGGSAKKSDGSAEGKTESKPKTDSSTSTTTSTTPAASSGSSSSGSSTGAASS